MCPGVTGNVPPLVVHDGELFAATWFTVTVVTVSAGRDLAVTVSIAAVAGDDDTGRDVGVVVARDGRSD